MQPIEFYHYWKARPLRERWHTVKSLSLKISGTVSEVLNCRPFAIEIMVALNTLLRTPQERDEIDRALGTGRHWRPD